MDNDITYRAKVKAFPGKGDIFIFVKDSQKG